MKILNLAVLATMLLAPPALQAQKSGSGSVARPMPSPSSPAPSHHGSAQGRSFSPMHTPPGFVNAIRPKGMPPPASNRAYWPRAMPRCGFLPDLAYWPTRDLLAEIQIMARQGFIPVADAGSGPVITGASYFPAGWIAYGFVVPGRQKLHVRLHHPNEGWFRLIMVDRWGQLREGMLQNLIPTGNPEVSYTNPADLANSVYVIVDDPGWMSSPNDPFTLNVDRSWDPTKPGTPALPLVHGIWAETKPAAPPAAKDQPKEAKAS